MKANTYCLAYSSSLCRICHHRQLERSNTLLWPTPQSPWPSEHCILQMAALWACFAYPSLTFMSSHMQCLPQKDLWLKRGHIRDEEIEIP
jgi:hypothetical protein